MASVITELVSLMREARDGKFKITNRDQDVHLAVERALTRRLGDPGRGLVLDQRAADPEALPDVLLLNRMAQKQGQHLEAVRDELF